MPVIMKVIGYPYGMHGALRDTLSSVELDTDFHPDLMGQCVSEALGKTLKLDNVSYDDPYFLMAITFKTVEKEETHDS